MSIRVMTLVWDASRAKSQGDLLVLLAIADYCRDDGTGAFPSIDTLATKARMDRRSVQRSVARLELLGELQVSRGSGRTRTNRYNVLVDNLRNKGGNTPPIEEETATSEPERAALVLKKGGSYATRSINEPSHISADAEVFGWGKPPISTPLSDDEKDASRERLAELRAAMRQKGTA